MPVDNFESYAELTGSFTDQSTEQYILSGSDVNLNIDYNDFSNHIVFGSAVTKLENFKSKISNIELYLNRISSSLSGSGVAIDGDSTARKDSRKSVFDNIQDVIDTFTPYERFLYYDHQSQTTSSAPGLGINLAHTTPATGSSTTLTNYEGFSLVYMHTGSDSLDSEGMNYFKSKYRAEEKPFFNYSGSLYLSFLLKGDQAITDIKFENRNLNYDSDDKGQLPYEALGSGSILKPSITGSEWRRFIFEASQSYWRPTGSATLVGGSGGSAVDFTDSATYQILSQSEQIMSASNVPASGSYAITLFGDFYPTLGTIYPTSGTDLVSTGFPFTGSLLPAGELFRISGSFTGIGNVGNITSSYMTDIKITTKNPLNTLPFSYTYKTGSSNWDDWYTGLQLSASAYDDKNIHSFISNLPDAIREDSDVGDLKQFLNMIGEQFDLVRNYIDNYQSFYKRRYDKLDSVPTNLLPILANSLGWDVTQILTGSLSQYFGTSQENIKVGGRTTEEITHNTWRKILNNLIYIYKTKGTLTGVNALLNVYGYPSDILKIQEIGGSTRAHSTVHITDDITKMLEGVGGLSGNASFIKFADELYSWIFNNNNARTLNFDWWTNSATDLNTVEFILKPHRCLSNDQILLESSGSGTEKLWDVRLLANGSDDTSGKLQFRLNNTHSGSSAIASNAVSMSTGYLPLKSNGNLWNVMLQRATSSISGTGIQTYKLFAGLQDKDKITQFSAVSMSVSGGTTADTNYYANQNWLSTGSLDTTSSLAVSGNLYIGRTYTGSLAEFRTWTTTLSASKFKHHILNKKSIVGNNINASRDEVTYRYSLQENWKRRSISPKIKDSNSNNVKDYTININTDLLTSSVLYDRDNINIVKFSVRIGGSDQPDDNKIIMRPTADITNNLSVDRSSESSIYRPDKYGEVKRYHTSKLQLVRSPQKILNEFIIDNLADYDISGKFADPQDLYETHYDDLNKLRDDLFNHFNVTININKWINAQANIFNPSIIESIQRVLPARSTTQNVGVMFEPTLLERDKIKNLQVSIATGSAIGQLEFTHDVIPYYDFAESAHIDYKTNLNPIEVASDISLVDSMYITSNDGEYSVADLIDKKGVYLDVKNAEYDIEGNITKAMSYNPSRNAEYDIEDNITKTISYKPSRNAEYDIEGNITKAISYKPSRNAEYDIEDNITKTISYKPPRNAEYDIEGNITKTISYKPSRNAEYDIEDNITKAMSYKPSRNAEYDIEDNIIKTISYKPSRNAEYDIEDNITKAISYKPSRNAEYDIEGNIIKTISYKPSRNAEYDIEDNITKTISYKPSRNAEYDIEDNITKAISYKPSRNAEYDIEDNITKAISYKPSRNAEYDIEDNITKAISYKPSRNAEYDIEDNITKAISYEPPRNIEYNVESNIIKDMSYELIKTAEYNVYGPITETGNIEEIAEGDNSWIASQSYASFVNLADSWGTSSDDVHFLAPNSASKLANVGYYEQDFVFKIVGDVEFILGQYKKKEFSQFDKEGENRMNTYRVDYSDVNFNNINFFLNREMRDKGKGYTYDSYIQQNKYAFHGPQDGRPVGKTSFYATKSNGDLVYPSNHWIHFSEDSLRSNFINGTQNRGGHYMQLNKWKDYSTASFYSVTVTGESGLEVNRGKQTIGSDGKVNRGGI